VLQREQIAAQIAEDEAVARQFERDGAAEQRLGRPFVLADGERSVDGRSALGQLPYGWSEAIDPRGIPYYYFFDGRTRKPSRTGPHIQYGTHQVKKERKNRKK